MPRFSSLTVVAQLGALASNLGPLAPRPQMTPQITLIKKCGADPLMSKRIFLDEQGTLRSDGSQCLMVQGIAVRAPAATASDLAKIIAGCSTITKE